jgi:hypothetical protein
LTEINNKNTLTLQDILENPVEILEIPGIGFVKVRCPTTKEKMDAKREALTLCEGMDEFEVKEEQTKLLSLKMLVEPKISIEQYQNSNDTKLNVILDTIGIWYTLKIKDLNDKRKELIKNFLEQMKESNQ